MIEIDKKVKCILLIEDCEADSYLHSKVIRGIQAAEQIVIKESGHDAMDFLRQKVERNEPLPEIIFLDINTPGSGGWDFVEDYKSSDYLSSDNTHLIMLSGSLNPDDKEKSKSYSIIQEYLQKPLKRDQLIGILENFAASARDA